MYRGATGKLHRYTIRPLAEGNDGSVETDEDIVLEIVSVVHKPLVVHPTCDDAPRLVHLKMFTCLVAVDDKPRLLALGIA